MSVWAWAVGSSSMLGRASTVALVLASASNFLFWAAVIFLPPTFGVSALSLRSNTAFFFATLLDSLSSALALLLAPELAGILEDWLLWAV